MRPSHLEIKTLWLCSYARTSLLEARDWLTLMEHTDGNTIQMAALTCATVVAYARPFTKSQITAKERVIPLREVKPPPRLFDTHGIILKLRDKVMGHKDATAAAGDSSTPNRILIQKNAKGFSVSTVVVEDLPADVRSEAKLLCSHFIAHCEAAIDSILTAHRAEIMNRPDGLYEILVIDGPQEWITAHK
jgi:hypothetical protein